MLSTQPQAQTVLDGAKSRVPPFALHPLVARCG